MNRKRLIAWLAVLALLLSAIPLSIFAVTGKASGSPVTVSNFSLHVNGEELKENTAVGNGDEVAIHFRWSISNTDVVTDTFTVDLQALSQNLKIGDFETSELPDNTGEIIGQFSIKNGVMTIKLSPEYVTANSERYGGANIDGVIDSECGEENDGEMFPVKIGNKTYNMFFDAKIPQSQLGVWKGADGNAVRSADGITQKFVVVLEAYSGEVKDLVLKETLGDGLSEMSSITVRESGCAGIAQGSVYGGIGELNKALEGKTLEASQKITLEYTVKVNPEIYHPDSLQTGFKLSFDNKVEAQYKNNKDEEKTAQSSASAQVSRPSVTKTGVLLEEEKTVRWTITLKLNDLYDLYDSSRGLQSVVSSVQDIPGDGLAGTEREEILSRFSESSPGVWTCTYETPVKEAYLESTNQNVIRNKVEAAVDKYTYAAEGTVHTPGRDWIAKSAQGYDPENKEISWKITLDKIPSGISGLTLQDTTTDWTVNGGSHQLVENVWIRNVTDGTQEKVVDNGIVPPGNRLVSKYENGTLTFLDSYVGAHAGDTLEILLTSQIQDMAVGGKNYQNKVTVSYSDAVGKVTKGASAVWRRKNALSKSGQKVQDEGAICYKVNVDLSQIDNLEAGTDIVLTDILAEGMKLEPSSVTIKGVQKDTWNVWDWNGVSPQISVEESEGNVVFSIPVTADLKEQAEAVIREGKSAPCVEIGYKTQVKDPVGFIRAGEEKTFTNTITGVYRGESIGDDVSSVQLEPQQVVTKTSIYDEATSPYVHYEIFINPDALDLSEGNLEAVDKMGSALIYDLNSIQVYAYRNNVWKRLDRQTEYTCFYNEGDNSVKYTLPDESYLRIRYRAKVNLYISVDHASPNGELTPENSYNTFELTAYTSDKTQASTSFHQMAITPTVWAVSTTSSVTIHKYYNDGKGNMKNLGGAVFRLVEVSWDSVRKEMTEGALVYDRLAIDDYGERKISNLKYDQIYALYEVEAPAGFERNTNPYYFVIPGSSNVTLPQEVPGKTLTSGSIINYENTIGAAEQGRLLITKALGGGVTREEAEGALKFSVRNRDHYEEIFYTLKDFTYEGETGIWRLELTLPAGRYRITETVTDIDGYTLQSVSYNVNGGQTTAGNRAEVNIEKDEIQTVAYMDSYTKKPSESENPTEPTKPSESENPTGPTNPPESENPTDPIKPSESENPTGSVKPSEGENPTKPSGSEEPSGKPSETFNSPGSEQTSPTGKDGEPAPSDVGGENSSNEISTGDMIRTATIVLLAASLVLSLLTMCWVYFARRKG